MMGSKLWGYGWVGLGHFSRIEGIFVYQDLIRHTVIHPNAGRLYDLLVVQSCYTNGTCRLPVLWCAGCTILSYTAMPAGCMIHWLYNHVIPMAHAVGLSYGVPAVSYCRTLQCLLVA